MLKLGVLISGRGSNLQALIKATQQAGFPAKIVCVIADKEAAGLDYAREAGISALTLSRKAFKDKQSFEEALNQILLEHDVQMVCMAGFMRLLSAWFVDRWLDRFINIHPSLLPSFPGLDTHKRALESGVKFTGCTVHFVRAQMDNGPIIAQAAVPVLPDDDEDTLAARVLEQEHKIYSYAVRLIAEGRVNIHNERTFIAGGASPEAVINPVIEAAV